MRNRTNAEPNAYAKSDADTKSDAHAKSNADPRCCSRLADTDAEGFNIHVLVGLDRPSSCVCKRFVWQRHGALH
jgi:hypothetical protein